MSVAAELMMNHLMTPVVNMQPDSMAAPMPDSLMDLTADLPPDPQQEPPPHPPHDPLDPRQAAKRLFADRLRVGWKAASLDTYHSADGSPLFHRVRLDPPPGSSEDKFIRPIHHDGKDWRIGEPPAPLHGKPLYRLPELLAADPAQPVYVVEGEKAARALGRLGVTVTTSGGASSARAADWTPLHGRRLRIWPDYDEAGARYAAEVATRMYANGCNVHILDPAPLRLPPTGDAYDWLAANPPVSAAAGAAALDTLPWKSHADDAPPPRPKSKRKLITRCLADIKPEPIHWLWEDRIALGKLTLIAGDPGLGKSMMAIKLAAHLSRGLPWPVGGLPCPQGHTLYATAEDGKADVVRPRFDAAGGDPQYIQVIDAVQNENKRNSLLCLDGDLDVVEDYLEQHPGISLVIIDPLASFLGNTDSHNNADVRAVLHPLIELAERHRVAIVAIAHLNKGNANGGPAIYRVSGSLAFVAAARCAFLVTKDRNDPERRLMVMSKNNLGPDNLGMAYRVRTLPENNKIGYIEWEEQGFTMSADEALAQMQAEHEEADDTADWIRDLLADGRLPAKRVQAAAESAGLHWRKVQRSMKAARAEFVREGFGKDLVYYWQLK